MNSSIILHALILAALFAVAAPARADYDEQLAERKELQASIESRKQAISDLERMQVTFLQKGKADMVDKAERTIKAFEKDIMTYRKKLVGVEAKIAKSEKSVKDAMDKFDRDRKAAQDAARDSAKTAFTNAKDAMRDANRSASRDTSKDTSKNSGKDSGQSAAKSSAHPPPPPHASH
jgi:hypothetical protein